jgi:hypothetical protein
MRLIFITYSSGRILLTVKWQSKTSSLENSHFVIKMSILRSYLSRAASYSTWLSLFTAVVTLSYLFLSQKQHEAVQLQTAAYLNTGAAWMQALNESAEPSINSIVSGLWQLKEVKDIYAAIPQFEWVIYFCYALSMTD